MINKPVSILLLRGLSREQRHWGGLPARFQQHYPEATIHCVDLPGNGQHNHCKSPMSIPETVAALRRDAPFLVAGVPLYLVAISLGGMVAMEWMNQYPDEVAAAVLMSSSFKGVSPFYQRLMPANYLNLLKAVFSGDVYVREKIILTMTSQLHKHDKQLLESWVLYARQNPVTKLNVLRQLLAAARYQMPRVKPEVPVLLLNGLQDQLVSPQCSAQLSQLCGWPLESHTLAGHDLSLDDEQWVFNTICGWFEGL